MGSLALVPHPDFPSAVVSSVSVDAGRRVDGALALRFRVEGNLGDVNWPAIGGPVEHTDGLWKHTCFEAFVHPVDELRYFEFNFTTSLQWAAYQFDSYRVGMRNLENVEFWGNGQPGLGKGEANFLVPVLAAMCECRLGLSAVIEEIDGTKSFWALAHAPGPPDFHNRDCFIATLPAPTGA